LDSTFALNRLEPRDCQVRHPYRGDAQIEPGLSARRAQVGHPRIDVDARLLHRGLSVAAAFEAGGGRIGREVQVRMLAPWAAEGRA
jgi:hypothetical protein